MAVNLTKSKFFIPDNHTSNVIWDNNLQPLQVIVEGVDMELDLNDIDAILLHKKEHGEMYFILNGKKHYVLKSQQDALWALAEK